MRAHRRTHPLVHVLVAGGLDDLASMRAVVASLPSDAYGQIILDGGDGLTASRVDELLAPPARVSITLIPESRDLSSAGTGVTTASTARGAALAASVTGWVGEWIPAEPQPDRAVAVWLGREVRDRLDGSLAWGEAALASL